MDAKILESYKVKIGNNEVKFDEFYRMAISDFLTVKPSSKSVGDASVKLLPLIEKYNKAVLDANKPETKLSLINGVLDYSVKITDALVICNKVIEKNKAILEYEKEIESANTVLDIELEKLIVTTGDKQPSKRGRQPSEHIIPDVKI